MVVSVGTATDVGYYTNGGGGRDGREAAPNYYTGGTAHGDPPGRWGGRLAEEFELSATVQDGQMESIYGTFIAPDGTRLGSAPGEYTPAVDRVESALAGLPADSLPEDRDRVAREAARSARSAVLGVDFTASPEKSFTVAHLAAWRTEVESTRSGDSVGSTRGREMREQFESALWHANQAMLDYTSDHLTARAGRHSSTTAGRYVAAPDALVASFHQHTSRAGDPQEHIHNVIMNRVRCEDGEFRAIDARDAMAQRWGASAVFHRELSERLADMGIATAVRPGGSAREIVAIPQEMLDTLSQRSQAITKAVRPVVERWEERYGRAPTALELSRLKQEATFRTRDSKTDANTNPDLMIERAQARLVEELGTGLLPVATRLDIAMQSGPIGRDSTFSPDAICQAAVADAALDSSSWTTPYLMAKIEAQLPLTGLSRQENTELLERLTDYTAEKYAVQVSGGIGIEPPEGLGEGSYVRPTDRRYAAPETLEAENLIRQAAITRGRAHLNAKDVNSWLDEHYPTIGVDQRAAVVGVASSDAALAQIIGPAGTGKSFAAGALAGVWEETTGGKVHGLTVGENASRILQGDGVKHTANIAAWLGSQDRLAAGAGQDYDLDRVVGSHDLLIIDEASMADTAAVTRVREIADRAGARVIFMGDHRQIGSIGAGGAMGLVEDVAETYALPDPRRFSSEWERNASLALRNGDVSALTEYDRHGRLLDAATMDDAIATASRSAAADRISGLSTVVTADTNEDAARVANGIREYLIEAGVVHEDGVTLGLTGSSAGLGDVVMARQNDYELGVINRATYEVVGISDDGSLSVCSSDGKTHELPADYVAEHLQLGYASTVHAAQGMTVDRGYTITDGRGDASSLYVGMTRGRDHNTAIVATGPSDRVDPAPYMQQSPELADRGAQAVLADMLERDTADQAATVLARLDEERLANMQTITARIEDAVQRGCRARMEGDLDRLVEDGALSMDDRARLAADQSSEHLSRLLRAGEQAGLDPELLLRGAVSERSLEGSRNVAQVLSGRITKAHDIAAATPNHTAPERLPEGYAEYIAKWKDKAEDRARELGSKASEDAPGWAARHLGPVPEDAMQRLEWETKAGRIAAFRESISYENSDRAIPSAPGVTTTEKRAAWHEAWGALGQPEETRAEAAMSDGRLRVRAAAWEREQQWAPPYADPSLRNASLEAERARQEAVLAEARGELEGATRLTELAERHTAVARVMEGTADARAAWAEETAVTRELAERAGRELEDRGVAPGHEPDRVDAREWLVEQQRSIEREDEHRSVTELDVPVHSEQVVHEAAARWWELDVPAATADVSPAQRRAPLTPDDLELEDMVRTVRDADDRVADRNSEETMHDGWEAELDVASDLDLDMSDVAEVAVPVLSASPFKPWPDED